MISLSDSELAAVMEAARTIPSRDRSEFLRDVVVELSKYPELGPGIIGPSHRDNPVPRQLVSVKARLL